MWPGAKAERPDFRCSFEAVPPAYMVMGYGCMVRAWHQHGAPAPLCPKVLRLEHASLAAAPALALQRAL